MPGQEPVRWSATRMIVAVVALVAGSLTGAGRAAASAQPAVADAASVAAVTTMPGYQPLLPVRICDTRAAGPTVAANQCNTQGHSPLLTGGILAVTVAGVAGVPADATAVVLHVTATGTGATSFLTVWPAGQAQPTAGSLIWRGGETVANLVATGVGTGGQVNVFNFASTADAVIDLQGYVAPTLPGLFTPVAPVRVCDTRFSQPATQCNTGMGAGALGAGQTRVVNPVTGFGVPAGATAVVLNVTATATSTVSYLNVWADGAAQPTAGSLIWAAGQTVSNRVITAISGSGLIDVFNAFGSTDLVIDMNGYFATTTGGSGFFPVTPIRLCDTRPAQPSNICNGGGPGTIPTHSGITLSPFSATTTAVVMNVTATNTSAIGYVSVFPDNPTHQAPLAADLAFTAGQSVSNLVIADVGPLSTIVIFNGAGGPIDVVVDVVGYFSTSATGSPAAGLKPSAVPANGPAGSALERRGDKLP